MAIGNIEQCPRCKAIVATPTILGGHNADSLERAAQDPMHRQYGEGGKDGAVFMGRGELAYTVRSPILVPVFASYDRNIRRALDLLDVFYEIRKEHEQVQLSAVYILTMTAYECLTDDLLKTLQSNSLAPEVTGRSTLHSRRELVFMTLGFTADDHVTALRYLYAFRNCLTHNAGVVDQEFIDNLKRIGPIPPILSTCTVGDPLVLEASTATSFADSLQVLAHQLFEIAQVFCDTQATNNG